MAKEKKSIFTFTNVFDALVLAYCILELLTNGFWGFTTPSYFLDSLVIIANIVALVYYLLKRFKKKDATKTQP